MVRRRCAGTPGSACGTTPSCGHFDSRDAGDWSGGMWDEEDGFCYDLLRLPDGSATRLKVRSMVGLLPLCATTVTEQAQRERVPKTMSAIRERLRRMPELVAQGCRLHGCNARCGPTSQVVWNAAARGGQDRYAQPALSLALSSRHTRVVDGAVPRARAARHPDDIPNRQSRAVLWLWRRWMPWPHGVCSHTFTRSASSRSRCGAPIGSGRSCEAGRAAPGFPPQPRRMMWRQPAAATPES